MSRTFFWNTLCVQYPKFAKNKPFWQCQYFQKEAFNNRSVLPIYRPQFVFLSHGSLFAIRNTAVQANFKRKVLVCIHGNQIIIVQRPSSIVISICHQNNKLTIAGLKRSPFYNDSFLCFCLDDTLKKNYFLLDIARPNHPPLLCTILTIFFTCLTTKCHIFALYTFTEVLCLWIMMPYRVFMEHNMVFKLTLKHHLSFSRTPSF